MAAIEQAQFGDTWHVVRQSQLQQGLEAGESFAGVFAPARAEFATPGVLSWSSEQGAELRLADLSHDWPKDFDRDVTVHGQLHDGGDVTLLRAHVRTRTAFDRTSRLTSMMLALGSHTDLEEVWPYAHYCPTGLHEWYPETGLKLGYVDEKRSRPRVELQRVRPVHVSVPEGEVRLSPGADWSWSFSPRWCIDTNMHFTVQPDQPLTIDNYWRRYGWPPLGFIVFASDRPDDVSRESFYNPKTKTEVVILRAGRRSFDRDWRPNDGHFLFKAEHVADISTVLTKWLALWRQTEPSLGLFCETIQDELNYSPARFLTLYTAAEGYYRSTKRDAEHPWKIDGLAARAGVDPSVINADRRTLGLIGRLRDYHAHLRLHGNFTAEEIARHSFDSTRRLHALLQACFLREIGLDANNVTSLISAHYRSWPIP